MDLYVLRVRWVLSPHKLSCVLFSKGVSWYETLIRLRLSFLPISIAWNTNLYGYTPRSTLVQILHLYIIEYQAFQVEIIHLCLRCRHQWQDRQIVCIYKVSHRYSKKAGSFTIKLPFNLLAASRVLLTFFFFGFCSLALTFFLSGVFFLFLYLSCLNHISKDKIFISSIWIGIVKM